jgi:hypothetical protein
VCVLSLRAAELCFYALLLLCGDAFYLLLVAFLSVLCGKNVSAELLKC